MTQLTLSHDEKASQLERDLRVPHPRKLLFGALRKVDDSEVTPFQRYVARQRLRELTRRGFDGMEGAIVMLMRGARREVVAAGMGYKVNVRRREDSEIGDFVADVRHGIRCDLATDEAMGEAQRILDLSSRA